MVSLKEMVVIAIDDEDYNALIPHNFHVLPGKSFDVQSANNYDHFVFVRNWTPTIDSSDYVSSDRKLYCYQIDPFKEIYKLYIKETNILDLKITFNGKLIMIHYTDRIAIFNNRGFKLITLKGVYKKVSENFGHLVITDEYNMTYVYGLNEKASLLEFDKTFFRFEDLFELEIKFRGDCVFISNFFMLIASGSKLSLFVNKELKESFQLPEKINSVLCDSLLSKIYCLCQGRVFSIDIDIDPYKLKNTEGDFEFQNELDFSLASRSAAKMIKINQNEDILYVVTATEILVFDFLNMNIMNKISVPGVNDMHITLDGVRNKNISSIDYRKFLAQK